MIPQRWLRSLTARLRVPHFASRNRHRAAQRWPNAPSVEILEERALLSAVTIEAIGTTINETEYAQVLVAVTGPEPEEVFTLFVDWDDGESVDTYSMLGDELEFSVGHYYFDDDPSGTSSDTYRVNLTVDCGAGTDTTTTAVVVMNLAPTIDGIEVPDVSELGGTITLAAIATDPSPRDALEYTWTITQPDESVVVLVGEDAVEFSPAQVGDHDVDVVVSDDDLGTSEMVGGTVYVGDTIVLLSDGDLYIDDVAPDGKFDTLTIQFDETADDVIVSSPDGHLLNATGDRVSDTEVRVPNSAFTGGDVEVDTGGGADWLTVDYSAGFPPANSGVTYKGGASNDQLRVTGGVVGHVVYTFSGPGSGTVHVDGTFIKYVGLSPSPANMGTGGMSDLVAESADTRETNGGIAADSGVSTVGNVGSTAPADRLYPAAALPSNSRAGSDVQYPGTSNPYARYEGVYQAPLVAQPGNGGVEAPDDTDTPGAEGDSEPGAVAGLVRLEDKIDEAFAAAPLDLLV